MYHFQSQKFKTTLFCNEQGVPFVLPNLFLYSLNKNKRVYNLKWIKPNDRNGITETVMDSEIIGLATIEKHSGELRKFLSWLSTFSKGKTHVSVDKSHNIPEEILNHYINQVLIIDRRTSENMVKRAVNCLTHFYNFIAYHGFSNLKNIAIHHSNRALAKHNTHKRNVTLYLSNRMRAEFFANAKCLREECLLRAGAECGLRSKENVGFVLNDFKLGNTVYSGMKTLFAELSDSSLDEQREFKFLLQGKFSKGHKNGGGGISRWLYMPRHLLEKFKLYLDTERPSSEADTLFLTASSNGYHQPIKSYQGTRDFKAVKERILEKQRLGLLPQNMELLEEEQSSHILRHSFGTDKFHQIIEERGLILDNVTHMDLPYLRVAELLGHSVTGDKAPTTTRRYIRSVKLKLNQRQAQ